MTISPVHSGTMGQERDARWTAETRLQPIFSKSDRLLLEREELNHVAHQTCLNGENLFDREDCTNDFF